MKKLIFILLLSTSSIFAQTPNCPNLEFDTTNPQAQNVSELVCDVILDSYPELEHLEILVTSIESSKMLSKFSKGRLTFISFFNLKRFHLSGKKGYLIGYSEKKLFQSTDTPSVQALKSVIAHELAHTLRWKRKGSLGAAAYAAYTTLGGEKIRGKYERSVDIEALYQGIISNHYYAQGLAEYRNWNLNQTDEDKRAYLKSVYYFEPQLFLIENLGRSLSGKTRRRFFKKLIKKAPHALEEIKAIYKEIIN